MRFQTLLDLAIVAGTTKLIGPARATMPPAPAPTQDKQTVVAECVERVLQILREREER